MADKSQSSTMQGGSASSRPTSAKRPLSGARTRPSSAVSGRTNSPRPMLTDPVKQVCAICRDQPLVFHECPDCSILRQRLPKKLV